MQIPNVFGILMIHTIPIEEWSKFLMPPEYWTIVLNAKYSHELRDIIYYLIYLMFQAVHLSNNIW